MNKRNIKVYHIEKPDTKEFIMFFVLENGVTEDAEVKGE
jgi:hypothetical protein